MNFQELHDLVPFAKYGKAKVLSMSPYNGVTLLLPGRHADESKGGDFCVCVDDDTLNWTRHQFTHTDIFRDVEKKRNHDSVMCDAFMEVYYKIVVDGQDPNDSKYHRDKVPGLHRQSFLYAAQCLAVAEHRRYANYEPKGGGRYLPLRFALGIAQGIWTAQDAADKQKYGRPAVERLEQRNGVPDLTQRLLTSLA